MGDLMKDDEKTKELLVYELTELRSQNAALEKSITGTIYAELALEEARRYAESIVATVREPLLVLDADLKIISANRNFYRTFKVTPGETIGSFIYDLGNKQWDIPKLRELLEEVLPEKEAFDDFEVEHNFQDIGHKIMLLNARQIYRKDIGAKMILLAIEDITEHKRLEDLLTESEERYRRLFETASDGIVLLEKREGKITHANPATEKMFGYTKKESIGNKLQDIGIVDIDDFQTIMQNLNKSGIINYYDIPVKTKSGQQIDTDIYLVDRARLIQCNIRDITDRKRAERSLVENEARLRTLVQTIPDLVWLKDADGVYLACNKRFECFFGAKETDIVGKTDYDFVAKELADFFREHDRKAMAAGKPSANEEWLTFADDGYRGLFDTIKTPMYDAEGKLIGVLGIAHDITKSKQAEEELRENRRRLADIVTFLPDATLAIDKEKRIIIWNKAIEEMTGVPAAEMIGKGNYAYTIPFYGEARPQLMDLVFLDNKEIVDKYPSITREGDSLTTEVFCNALYNNKGAWVFAKASPLHDQYGNIIGAIESIRDITNRKHAEEALLESEAKYRNIFENATEGIYQATPEGRFITVNSAFARMAGYDSPDDLIESIEDIGTQLYAHPEDRKRFLEIMAKSNIVKGFEVKLYKKNGSTFWGAVNSRAVKDNQGETLYFEGITEDITLRKQAEEKLLQTLDNLRRAFSATVQVLIAAVESRDPYTAGHQVRSADLARAIASEMGLSQERIDGIRIAGSIHDVGKISVPAEILSNPRKLTELEFSLIKEHAYKGFEMLKDVESPWPLAEIIYQHHERIDGSGYPRKLKGDDILLEARILAVADVVEAMASHRPYRAALGLNAALVEIENHKGTLYDAEAVDACLRLFREKGFQFEGTGL